MIKIGIIGYGSMGSMLLNGFISQGKISPENIIVSTKTKSKLNEIKNKWDKINITENNSDVAKKAKYIFICVKPRQVKEILNEIKDLFSEEKHIISIAGCVSIGNIEQIIAGKITKIIPSITSEVYAGVTLVCHNNKVSKEDMMFIETLLGCISSVKLIKESDFEAATDLTSCAPGLISEIFHEFLEAALRNSTLSKEDAEYMIVKTLYGTSKLFHEKNFNFEQTLKRVARPGGITEEGVKVLKAGLPQVFDELFQKTFAKHEVVKKEITLDFIS